MFYIIIAILTGSLVTLSRLVNSNLSDEIGIFQSTFYNYFVGLIASLVVLIFSNDSILTLSQTFSKIPLWAFTGGFVGVIVVALSSFVTPKISVFYLTILTFIGQLFTGIIMDYYTLNILSTGKLLGGFFVLAGLIINVLIDKKDLAPTQTAVSANV